MYITPETIETIVGICIGISIFVIGYSIRGIILIWRHKDD